ncbi:MAG: hypothetical protein IKU46_06165 [Peptococcaceae bacterium]|nr:hypothetical protein [Peptococcaceae bacterium]
MKKGLGFVRFSVRGKEKVFNETGLVLMTVNIRKFTVKWANC